MHNQSAKLRVPVAAAVEKIGLQLSFGEELLARRLPTEGTLQRSESDFLVWSSATSEVLQSLTNSDALSVPFDSADVREAIGVGTFLTRVEYLQARIRAKLAVLRDLTRLTQTLPGLRSPEGLEVFVVHGHDTAARHEVCTVLQELALVPIVLAELPNAGKTVIEKLESASDVTFAVVLLTPDDVGAPRSANPTLRPRARQNVIFELGYFTHALGRERVAALYVGDLELPSDYHGVLYIQMDQGGAWKLQLCRELKEAGIDVDLNQLS